MRSVTLDSNIYVSAIRFGGKPLTLLQLGLDGEIDIAISKPILDETLRILLDKFGTSESGLHDAETLIEAATRRVSPAERIDAVPSDPADNRILECAVTAGSEVIVTGDLDLLRLSSFRGMRIERPGDFLGRLANRAR